MDVPKGDVEKRWVQQGRDSYAPEKEETGSQSLGRGFLAGEFALPCGLSLQPCPETILMSFFLLMP
jgi:hypothetical protein